MDKTGNHKILLIAGESSGDLHAALLARQIREDAPGVGLYGCGGKAMAGAGVRMLADLVCVSVVGGAEVLKKFMAIGRVFQDVVRFLDREKPDAVVLVDYPGFNLRVAEVAKKRGIGVIYYVSPQIWAWAPSRIHKIRRVVDLMLVILPFEKEIYEQAGVPVRYVGHPSLDRTVHLPTRQEWLTSQGMDSKGRFIALLPGSRAMEVQKILPVMLKAASIIAERLPETTFLLACAGGHVRQIIERMAKACPLNLRVVEEQAMEVTGASDLALVASGTATLETALMGTPMLIVYKVSLLTYLIARTVIRIPFLGLVNVLAGRAVVSEFLQFRAKGGRIAQEALAILADARRASEMKAEFENIRRTLGPAGASARAAACVIEWLQKKEMHAPVS